MTKKEQDFKESFNVLSNYCNHQGEEKCNNGECKFDVICDCMALPICYWKDMIKEDE